MKGRFQKNHAVPLFLEDENIFNRQSAPTGHGPAEDDAPLMAGGRCDPRMLHDPTDTAGAATSPTAGAAPLLRRTDDADTAPAAASAAQRLRGAAQWW